MKPATITDLDHVQVAIPPNTDAEARTFYGEVLGLAELRRAGSLSDRGGMWFRLGSGELHLGVEDDFRPARKAHPAFVTENLDRLRQTLEGHGYEIKGDVVIPGRRRFFSVDPFGNRLEFIEFVTSDSQV